MTKNILVLLLLSSFFSVGQVKNEGEKTTVKENTNASVKVISIEDDGPAVPTEKNNKINPDTETIFKASEVDKFPEYPGGIKKFYVYAQKNFIIPKEIKEKKIKGKVFISFVVERDGNITNIKVIRDMGYGTKEEAEKLLKKCPKWNPATINGKIVRCEYNLPIIVDGEKA